MTKWVNRALSCRRYFFVKLILLLFLTTIGIGFYQFKYAPLAIDPQSPHTVKLPSGMGADYVLQQLQQQQHLQHRAWYKPWVYGRIYGQHLKAGEYGLQAGQSLSDLIDKMLVGKVLARQFTIVEGWRYRDLKRALLQDSHLQHCIQNWTDAQLQQELGLTFPSVEGLFFPDTYFYTWGESDFDILKQAQVKMQIVLQRYWNHRQADLPYANAYQALIAASLIEKETALAAERPLVASVIVNRLLKKMRLQVDASVLYGLGTDQTALTRADIKRDTAYNTYTRDGLPPTPIAMSDETAIRAALQPAYSHYLYYVAKGDASHAFSQDYEQHLAAVNHYQKSGES